MVAVEVQAEEGRDGPSRRVRHVEQDLEGGAALACRRAAPAPAGAWRGRRGARVRLDDDEAHRRRRRRGCGRRRAPRRAAAPRATPLSPVGRRPRTGGRPRSAAGRAACTPAPSPRRSSPRRAAPRPAGARARRPRPATAVRLRFAPRTFVPPYSRAPKKTIAAPGFSKAASTIARPCGVERHARARRRPVLARHGVLGHVALPAARRWRRSRSRPAPSRARSSRAPRRCRRPPPSAPATRPPCCRAPAATGRGSSRCARRPRATPRAGRPRCRRARG